MIFWKFCISDVFIIFTSLTIILEYSVMPEVPKPKKYICLKNYNYMHPNKLLNSVKKIFKYKNEFLLEPPLPPPPSPPSSNRAEHWALSEHQFKRKYLLLEEVFHQYCDWAWNLFHFWSHQFSHYIQYSSALAKILLQNYIMMFFWMLLLINIGNSG